MIGLDMKNKSTSSELVGFTKNDGNTWYYSQATGGPHTTFP